MQKGKTMSYFYEEGGEELLDRIEPLWNLLNRHHRDLASQHKEHYDHMTFTQRRQMITNQASDDKLKVILVYSENSAMRAYCVSLVDINQRGELASIFVDADLRGQGVGHILMEKALAWMYSEGARDVLVTVLPENLKALDFYKDFGFFARLILMLKPEPSQ